MHDEREGRTEGQESAKSGAGVEQQKDNRRTSRNEGKKQDLYTEGTNETQVGTIREMNKTK